VDTLSEEQLADFKEAFELHDEEGLGAIKTSALGPVLRSLGQHFGKDEIQKMVEEVDPKSKGDIDFQTFLLLLAQRMEDKESDEDVMVLQAFQVFDKSNSGEISVDEVRHVFSTIGGQEQKVVDELIKVADPKNTGFIEYKSFIKKMGDGQ